MPLSPDTNERTHLNTSFTQGPRDSTTMKPLLDGNNHSSLLIILQREALVRSVVNQEDVPRPPKQHIVFQSPYQSSDG